MVKKDTFTNKMLSTYEQYEGDLQSIVDKREEYTDAPEYKAHRELLTMFDMSQQFSAIDRELSDALHATALWFTYNRMVTETPQFVDVDEDKDTMRLNYDTIATFLIKRYCIVSSQDEVYIYINDRYYVDHGRLRKDIIKILQQTKYSETRKIEQVIRDIIFRIKGVTTKFSFPFNTKARDLIPVRNGVIVRRSLNVLLPKSPVWGFTYSLPVVYDPTASTGEVEKFLTSLVAPEDVPLLTQIPAQALMQNANYQLAYLLTGGGANGKSTYIGLLRALVGVDSISAVSLQEIAEDKFKAAELQGKLLNIHPDLPKTSLRTTGKIKALTGGEGDLISAERKYLPPFTFVNKAVFVFSANELPPVEDSTFAFWRRWEVIQFPNVFPRDHKFVERLITPRNLSGFLNLIIRAMDEIERDGVKRTNNVEKVMELWKSRSNSSYAFIRENIEKDPNGWIPKDSAYNVDYVKFCEENDVTVDPKSKFAEEMEKAGAVSTQITYNRQRIRVFKGVKYKSAESTAEHEKKETDKDSSVFDKFKAVQSAPEEEQEDESYDEDGGET